MWFQQSAEGSALGQRGTSVPGGSARPRPAGSPVQTPPPLLLPGLPLLGWGLGCRPGFPQGPPRPFFPFFPGSASQGTGLCAWHPLGFLAPRLASGCGWWRALQGKRA